MAIMTIYRAKASADWVYTFDAGKLDAGQSAGREEIHINVPDPMMKVKWDGSMVLTDPAIPGHYLAAAEVAELARRGQRGFSMAVQSSAA